MTGASLDLTALRLLNAGMMMSGAVLGLGLMNVPVLIAQWVGVLAMRGGPRNGAWWCLLTGTGMSTLGFLLGVALMLAGALLSGGAGEFLMMSYVVLAGLQILGSMVFAAGFAMHGIGRKRERDRVAELEMVIAAQNEQLAAVRA